MKIYTKTGDKGQTSLWDGERVDKDSLRVESYGTVDELNATIGIARNYVDDQEIKNILLNIQRKMFVVGADLSTKKEDKRQVTIKREDVEQLESIIDNYIAKIDSINKFIIAGSNLGSAHLDLARAVARRAERIIIRLSKQEEVSQELLKYINRLSDTLYALERYLEIDLIYFEK